MIWGILGLLATLCAFSPCFWYPTSLLRRGVLRKTPVAERTPQNVVNQSFYKHHLLHQEQQIVVRNSTQADRLSLQESFGFLQYSDEQWRRLRVIHAAQSTRQRGDKSRACNGYYQNNWEPTFSCAFEQRAGSVGDGGKWVCDAYRIAEMQHCNIVSVGSRDDWSFEEAMHKLNPRCKIFTFDPTTNAHGKPDFVSFYKIGLGVGGGSLVSLSNMLNVAGLQNSTVDVFKIDCEGCEWSIWPSFSQVFFRQVLIELHGCANADAFFEGMAANGYVIFHKEPNIAWSNGDCIEYGFLKLAPTFHAASVGGGIGMKIFDGKV